jgi:hypothetical protein
MREDVSPTVLASLEVSKEPLFLGGICTLISLRC